MPPSLAVARRPSPSPMKAIRIQATGGPEVLRYEEIPQPTPGPGQVLIRVEAAGVNYIDTYHRSGLYRLALPATLGQEGAGTVAAVGPGVTGIKPQARVAWTGVPGSYAEYVVAPANRLVSVPAALDPQAAAAAMFQGMTAHYLACTTFPPSAGGHLSGPRGRWRRGVVAGTDR